MSKGRHTRDRMYISASEHAQYGTGYRGAGSSGVRQKLLGDFRNCALSMQPFSDPVAAPDGSLFDLTSIVPFLRKHGKHPISGEPLSAKDLVHLNFHRNPEGEFCCPVTNKLFNEHTKIVAIRQTGNVYSWDAISNLCIAAKNWKDLLTDEPFTRADILTLQDPTNAEWLKKRDVNTFFHVRASSGAAAGGAAVGAVSGGAGSSAAAVAAGKAPGIASSSAAGAAGASAGGAGPGSAPGVVIRSDDTTKRVLAELAERERDGTMPTITGTKRRREDGLEVDATAAAAAAGGHVTGYGVKTTGRYTASFTSTGMSLVTRNEAAPETEADRREKRWTAVRKLGKKAYVRIATNKGALNVELHADLAPRCVDNFLLLAKRGYYDGTRMHRLVRNFIVQGGDPTGTGRGGDSAWGGAFADEFHPRLGHGERGVLSMANSGPNSNKSQFFFVLAPAAASHLDGKHSVFGRVVGGLDALRAIELVHTRASEAGGKGGKAAAAVASDPDKDRPLEDVVIEGITIFADPFAELEAAGAIPAGTGAAAGASAGPARAAAAPSAGAGAGAGAGASSHSKGSSSSAGSAGSSAGVGAAGGSLLLSMLPAPGTGGAGSSGGAGGGSGSGAAAAPPPGSAAIAAAAAARVAAAAASGSAVAGGGASIAARLAAGTSAVSAPGRVVTPAEVAAAARVAAERASVTWMSDPAPKPKDGAPVGTSSVGRYLPPAAAAAGAAAGRTAAGASAAAGASSAASAAGADKESLLHLAAAMEAGLEAAPQPKRKPAAGSFGDFSGW